MQEMEEQGLTKTSVDLPQHPRRARVIVIEVIQIISVILLIVQGLTLILS